MYDGSLSLEPRSCTKPLYACGWLQTACTLNLPPDHGRHFACQPTRLNNSVQSQITALRADPDCAMCEWGLAVAYGLNLNDALVMSLEAWFLDNESLAYEAFRRAQTPLSSQEKLAYAGSERDAALVSAVALKYVATVDEYKSFFVDGLPASLNPAYAEAAVLSGEEGWPDHAMVLLLAANAWMNTAPWDCEFSTVVVVAFSLER